MKFEYAKVLKGARSGMPGAGGVSSSKDTYYISHQGTNEDGKHVYHVTHSPDGGDTTYRVGVVGSRAAGEGVANDHAKSKGITDYVIN